MSGTLPPRTADTMSMAIAMSSPNGRMSKRSQEASRKALHLALFGDFKLNSLPPPEAEQIKLRRNAAMWRDLAARGMKPRKFIKMAIEAELKAALKQLEATS